MLTQRFPPETLRLVSQADWHPYPTADQRDRWNALSARTGLIEAGEAAFNYQWKPILATRFLEYARVGNRSRYEAESFERRNMLLALALAECAEGKGRFVDQIANGVWAICEETYWGVPAHIGMQHAGVGLPDASEPTVDLFAAETAAALAYIYDLLGTQLDSVSPLIKPRIAAEIQRRILTPNLEREDFHWMGFDGLGRPNNWNPWVNSNWLACVLFIEPDQDRRQRAVAKIMRSLDLFLDPYPSDGGCDEGPGYWTRAAGSLYDCLDLFDRATDGQVSLRDQPVVQEMGRFIYRAHIDGKYYLNFADASAVTEPEAALAYAYGEYIHDPDMQAFGAWAWSTRRGESWGSPILSPMRRLRTIFLADELSQAEAYAPQPREVWLPVIQVMMARDQARSASGFYVAAKGGNNNESHNHNDIGEFVVYLDGKPLLIDAGVETYRRQTFSPQRYEIWTMQSAYHNLPTIDGVQQQPGEQFAARDLSYADSTLSLDIAAAYPPEAGITYWHRRVSLARGQSVTVEDDYQLDHPPASLTLSLLTVSKPTLELGEIRLDTAPLPDGRMSASGVLHYSGASFTASVEQIDITDNRMMPVWGSRLFRILLTADSPQPSGSWKLEITR